jgi:hypothetical protein
MEGIMKRTLTLAVVGLMAVGCLTHEARHVFYVDPDGSVTWTVLQEEVRSDASDRRERDREEEAWQDAVRCGEHPVAKALSRLGPRWVESRFVRDRSPYTVVTEARFDSLATALERFLRGLGLEATAELWFEEDLTHLRFSFSEPEQEEADDGRGGAEEHLDALLEDVERYRFVLTGGKFVAAEGFRLEANETAAVLLERSDEEIDASRGAAVYSLTWASAPGNTR